MKKDPAYAEAIANALVLQVIIGKDPQELIAYVHALATHFWRDPILILFCCFQFSEEDGTPTCVPGRFGTEERAVRHRGLEIQCQGFGVKGGIGRGLCMVSAAKNGIIEFMRHDINIAILQ